MNGNRNVKVITIEIVIGIAIVIVIVLYKALLALSSACCSLRFGSAFPCTGFVGIAHYITCYSGVGGIMAGNVRI